MAALDQSLIGGTELNERRSSSSDAGSSLKVQECAVTLNLDLPLGKIRARVPKVEAVVDDIMLVGKGYQPASRPRLAFIPDKLKPSMVVRRSIALGASHLRR